MEINKSDNKAISTHEKITFEIGGRKGNLLISKDQCDTYFGKNHTIHLIGNARAYSKDNLLTAKDIHDDFKGDVEQLYARLSGRFIMVINDHENEQMSVFNDHMGSMPFYYLCSENELLISPTLNYIKQESAQTLALSSQALFHYCYFHCIPAPTTIYEGVNKLSPAEHLLIKHSTVVSKGTLYCPEFQTENAEPSLEEQCLSEIETAVSRSLSDNCGAFLSGGLDSSTVAGMLAKLSDSAKTYSVGFKEPGYDETEYALLTAKHFGTDHDAAYLEPEYISENFKLVASSFDEPFGNSSALAAYFCASYAKSKGINSLLAGDGGDELFAGNSRYAKQKFFFPYEGLPGFIKAGLKLAFVRSPLAKVPGFSKVCSYINQAENPLPDRLQAYNFLHRFPPSEIFTQEFLANVDTKQPLNQLRERYKSAKAQSPIDNMLYMDWKFTLADNDLIKVSKMCELAGVDVKFPLLEKELVDFSCKVPANVKLPGQKLRDFFKQATRNFLAPATLSKSKHGFGLPFGRWMKSTPSLVEVTEQALTNLKSRNIVKAEFIDKALTMQSEEHSAYYGELIWILAVMELWLESRETA